MKHKIAASALVVMLGAGAGWSVGAQGTDGPQYTADNKLVRPTNYREWMFVTSGLGMTYGPAASASPASPRFDNVFVNPSSYRRFMQTGKWPDKTVLILEIRTSASEQSINKGGHFQTGVVAIEAAVKDETRFPDQWTYYNFGTNGTFSESTGPLSKTASCYTCHSKNTAVEWTFVQFYPTLFEVAKRMGTVKPTYDPAEVPRH